MDNGDPEYPYPENAAIIAGWLDEVTDEGERSAIAEATEHYGEDVYEIWGALQAYKKSTPEGKIRAQKMASFVDEYRDLLAGLHDE